MEGLIVTFVKPDELKCTCSRFQKSYICEHVLATSVVLNEKTIPLRYSDTAVGSGPVVGRPRTVQPQQPKKLPRHKPLLPRALPSPSVPVQPQIPLPMHETTGSSSSLTADSLPRADASRSSRKVSIGFMEIDYDELRIECYCEDSGELAFVLFDYYYREVKFCG
jgi:hypothetical protein